MPSVMLLSGFLDGSLTRVLVSATLALDDRMWRVLLLDDDGVIGAREDGEVWMPMELLVDIEAIWVVLLGADQGGLQGDGLVESQADTVFIVCLGCGTTN